MEDYIIWRSCKNFLNENNVTIEEIREVINQGLTIEKVDPANPFVGISKLHELTEGSYLPSSKNIASFFEYYKTTTISGYLLNLGMFVVGYNSSYTPGIMFLIDKFNLEIEICNKNNGSTELLGKLYLANNNQSPTVRT
jgi:hypothetical protein